jgi:hypothetical protein
MHFYLVNLKIYKEVLPKKKTGGFTYEQEKGNFFASRFLTGDFVRLREWIFRKRHYVHGQQNGKQAVVRNDLGFQSGTGNSEN